VKKARLFLIDDDADQLALLTAQLERSGSFVTESFTSPREALARVLADPPDGVVCDFRMPGLDGLEVTRRLRVTHPFLPIIIATGVGSAEDAAACFEAGATDFVTKPVDPGTLIARIRKAVQEVPARELLVETARARFDRHGIIGAHPRIREVRAFVDGVAAVRGASVLLLGESGTGKNLVARAIHAAGDVSSFRFVEVNCAALPGHLLEAELFGYEKGAFTDARQTKKGLVEDADGGTLFLDEIGSMPVDLQAKLLTFLESRSFRRIGSTREQSVTLRVVAATNSELPRQVREGTFREDLYYRLNVASHTLPPLREIRSDIEELARHFVKRAADYFRKPEPALDAGGVRALEAHDWPGNARELRNVIERAMIFSKGPVLELSPETIAVGTLGGAGEAGSGSAAGLPSPGGPATAAAPDTVRVPRGLTLEAVERLYIESTLRDVDGRVNEAAAQLGMTRKVFWARRKRLGLL